MSLVMLSLCYLPDALASFLQLYRGTGAFLIGWIAGCCAGNSFKSSGTGDCLSACALYTYQSHTIRENRTTEFDTTMAWRATPASLGILGFSLYVLLGITSLPSVSNILSWREFSFIQFKLGHQTLLLCTAHTYLYGWNKFLSSSTYKWYTPPGYMLCLVLPSVVLLLKLLLITPCVDRTITRIRQGWERGADQRNPKDSQPLILYRTD